MNRNLTILVVEDEPDDVFFLRRALTEGMMKNPIQIVSSGDQAIEYLEGRGVYSNRLRFPFPSVIFSDLHMNDGDGFKVLDWIRNHPKNLVVPLIVLSSSSREADIVKAYAMGATAYIIKPSSIAKLGEILKAAHTFWAFCEKPRLVQQTA